MKDIIIIIIVLFIIIGSGIFVQNYIKFTSEEMTQNLKDLKDEIIKTKEINKNVKKKADKIYEQWQRQENKWSVIVLHDELDLIETSIVSMKCNIETGIIDMSMEEIEKSIFLLEHIYEKERFCFKNIF